MTTLPELPRVLNQHETKSSALFSKWLEANPDFSTGSLEMKDTRGKGYLPFSEVKDEQINWGLRISSPKGALIRVIGLNGQPDFIWMRNAPAWIVIRYPKKFEVISVRAFDMERRKTEHKSLSSSRAAAISTITIPL